MTPPPNKTNTRQGINIEELLQNSLPHHPRAFGKVKEAIGVPMSVRPIQDGYNVGRKKRKTDAVFQFGDKYPILRVSVKSFSKSGGYNHVERKSLSTFCREYQISVSDQEFLKTLFLRKAVAAKGKHTHLVEQDEQSRVHEIFKHLEVGATALLGRDHPQIFAIYSIERSRWHLYDIRKQVLPVIRQHTVTLRELRGTSSSETISYYNEKEVKQANTAKAFQSLTYVTERTMYKLRFGCENSLIRLSHYVFLNSSVLNASGKVDLFGDEHRRTFATENQSKLRRSLISQIFRKMLLVSYDCKAKATSLGSVGPSH